MHSPNCLNCGVELPQAAKYCLNCSQPVDTHRFSIAHIFHEGFHAFTHADMGVLKLIKGLATQPGTVVREYIEGKRKKYFNPFSFLLLCLAVFLFMNSIFKPFAIEVKPNAGTLRKIPTEKGKQMYLHRFEKINKVNGFTSKNTNVMSMIATPIISLVLYGLFRKLGFNYAEHLVANVFLTGFFSIVATIIFVPIIGYFKSTVGYYPLIGLHLLLWGVYIGWAYYQWLGFSRRISALKTIMAAVLGIIIWSLISASVIVLVIRFS